MERYLFQPKFKKTFREGKVALWVKMPEGHYQNIWDIEKTHYNKSVLSAIQHSFEIGFKAALFLTRKVDILCNIGSEFEEE